MLATHWDGYPASLGRDLLKCDKSLRAVIEVAKAHTIDAADPQLLEALNRERVEQLAQKHQLTVQEIKAGKRRGKVICADDYEIADIGLHRDLAEFQYDIRGNDVLFRRLDGWWPESLRKAEEFRLLAEKEVAAKHSGKPLSPLQS
jgi:hypothetical protein